jgi:hypothetical protein
MVIGRAMLCPNRLPKLPKVDLRMEILTGFVVGYFAAGFR